MRILLLLLFTLPATMVRAASPTSEFPLWPAGSVPEATGTDPVRDVPTLTPYLPAKPDGAAIIVCPGGGYGMLAGHEGKDYALWLNQRGIAAYVLKYRLGSNGYRHPAEMHDVLRAIRYIRSNAAEWGLNPARIGLMGSSAGGHLTATAMTLCDAGNASASDPIERASSRPDLGILCYPVISMGQLAHGGSRDNLLGKNPSRDLVYSLSPELHVRPETPPCFIWTTRTDTVVDPRNSIVFAQALMNNGVPFELHIYENGPHGQGLGIKGYDPSTNGDGSLLQWTRDLDAWLKARHFSS